MRMGGMTGWVAVAVTVLLAVPAAGSTYALCHDSTEGRETALVVTNVEEVDTPYTVTVYDAEGTLIGKTDGELSAYGSEVVFLDDIGMMQTAATWGLVRIDTPNHVSAATWIRSSAAWLAVENAAIPIIDPSEDDHTYYWFTTNYANTSMRTTAFGITNPYGEFAQGTVWVYDSSGQRQLSADFALPPHASNYYVLSETLSATASMWGMIDVRATAPILLLAEYFDAEGRLIDSDLTDLYYFVQ